MAQEQEVPGVEEQPTGFNFGAGLSHVAQPPAWIEGFEQRIMEAFRATQSSLQ